MQRPLLPILCSVMIGIAFGYLLEIRQGWILAGLLAGTTALFISLWMNIKSLVLPCAMMIMFLLSILNINLYLYQVPGPTHIMHYAGPDMLTVEGLVSEPPRTFPDRVQLTVVAQRLRKDALVIPIEGNILLNIATNDAFRYGQVVRFKTRLRIPHSFQNPGGFDYEKHLKLKGILVQGFIINPAHIIILRENQGYPLRMHLEALRDRLKELIRTNAASPVSEIVQAMILGNQNEIPKGIMDQFNRTGTSHIIAISGFNVGIITLFAIFIIRIIMKSSDYLLLRFNIIKFSTALAFIPVAIFTFIAGMGISVIRATIMALSFLVALILGKDRDLYNTLALAALLILVVSPSSLFDISFQLSFSAVAALLFITPKLTGLMPAIRTEGRTKTQLFFLRRLYDIALFIIVSISATLGTLPLIVFYFNRVSLVSLPANLAVVPIMGIIALPVCTAIILAAPLSEFLTILLIKLSAFLVKISLALVDYFASLSWAAYSIVTPNIIEIAAYYLLLFLLFCLIGDWMKKRHALAAHVKAGSIGYKLRAGALAGFLAFFCGYMLYGHFVNGQDRDLRITAIDVGQGNSTLIRFPNGKKMLIDGGGSFNEEFDIGRYVVAPFLWHERIGSIDIVVLTHIHPDHLNGLKFIIENFNVGEFWSNGQRSDATAFREIEETIAERKIGCRRVSAQTAPFDLAGVRIEIFNPVAPIEGSAAGEQFDETNNHSVAMKLTHGAISFMLPADISEPTESLLVHRSARIKSNVLFVPHHGSRTSSTESFIDAIQPRLAVISCGKDNYFRLPHPEVLKRYDIRKIQVLRTDRDGAITVATDGRDLRIHAFTEQRRHTFPGTGSPDDR